MPHKLNFFFHFLLKITPNNTFALSQGMSVTDLYVTNLAVADVLLLVLLPMYAAEMATDEWKLGPVLCKV